MTEETWTVKSTLQWATQYLESKKVSPSPRLDIELLLTKALNFDRLQIYLQHDRPLTHDERAELRTLLKRRSTGEPIAYILGRKEFWKSTFFVNSDVLIPRPETELLVETALQWTQARTGSLHILDMGTGSGCIALSIAKERPHAQVLGIDICAKALSVAERNRLNLQLDNVDFENADMKSWDTSSRFHLIISNPPYIVSEDLRVERYVKEFEPGAALFALDGGLEYYEAIGNASGRFLLPDGMIAVEIAAGEENSVTGVFQRHGFALKCSYSDANKIVRALTFERST